MPPTPLTCIACGRAFAPNRELASIPDASKIAFDPALRRVWRICASCNEWNLLGADAAATALPEIEARFAAAMPAGAANSPFAPARLGTTAELVRVGVTATDPLVDAAESRLRAEVDRRARQMRWMMAIGGAALLGWCGFMLWISHGDAGVPILLFSMYSAVGLLQRIADKLRGKRVTVRALALNALLVGVAYAMVVAKLGLENLKYELVGVLGMIPMVVVAEPIFTRLFPAVRTRLASGRTLWLNVRQIRQLTLTWQSDSAEISICDLPRDQVLSGPDGAGVFRRVYGFAVQDPGSFREVFIRANPTTETAFDLLRSVGGLRGLLHALEGFRNENNGRVLIGDLPRVYLIALDLALADRENSTDLGESLKMQAQHAAVVASEAERLDLGNRSAP